MSEIKGQLLGIIIVLMVFAAVGGTMVTLFTSFSKTVENNVNSLVEEGIENGRNAYQNSELASYAQGNSGTSTGNSVALQGGR